MNNPDAWPLAPSVNGAPRVQQNIDGTNAYFVPGTNPAVANLLNDLRNPDGSTAFTPAQIAAITSPANPGRVGLQNSCGSRSATAARRAATSIARKDI